MAGLPAVSNDKGEARHSDAAGPAVRRPVGAAIALAVGIGAVILFLVAVADPARAPFIGAAVVLSGVAALWVSAWSAQRRLKRDLRRLAEENGRAVAAHARAALAEERLRDSVARYRALADSRNDVERALVEARRRAEAASEAKSRFLAAVSHEFRTPLNGILGLNALLRESGLTPDQETYARGVQSSGEALLALVDDMLDFSKIESGRLDLQPEPTGLERLAEEVVELLAARAYGKGIDLAADIEPLPQVAVDGARLRQVLINLVGNGVKFTETGGVALRLRSMATSEAGRVRVAFSVADSGPGIAAADVERVFGEFEQGDSAIARRHGGAGLGLAISQRIVRAMGGSIGYSGRAGGGAEFAFTLDLPVAGGPVQAEAPPLAGRQLLVAAPPGAEAPILAAMLRRAGADARIAATVVEAAALAGAAAAATTPYDAVLLDARLAPDVASALESLRAAAGTALPVGVLVEPAQRGRIDALREAGFDAYLVRPVRRASLLRVAEDLAAGSPGFGVDPGDVRPGPPSVRRAGRSLDILLAEDNEINALLARAVLESLGHRVTQVADGLAAVAAVREHMGRFAAILMDLHMPGLDGIAAARAIRAFEAESGTSAAAILAVTADVLAETRAAASLAGIDAVLEKPVAPEALREAIVAVTAG